MVRRVADGFEYLFPGNRPLSDAVGPTVHPDMQIPQLTAEKTADEAICGGRRMQWYVGAPHRFEKAEVYVVLRGSQDALDATHLRAAANRYRGGVARGHLMPVERVFRCEEHGYGTRKFLPPLGPRERDDYVFRIPDSGWTSITVDILGANAATLQAECWITGYESPARQTLHLAAAPDAGPLLPPHPYGFSTALRLT